jgi:putative oxidoreductase
MYALSITTPQTRIRGDIMSLGLLLLRLAVGLTLAAHGAQKLFGWFGGPGLAATGAGMEHLGFVPGRRAALAAGLAETAAGLLLALGLGTPAAAAIVFAVMVVAGVSAHLERGFFLATGGYEYTLILAVSGLSLAFTGPGRLSLDAIVGLDLSGVRWGLAALLVGLAGSTVQLAGRRPAATSPQAAASTRLETHAA